MSKRICIVGGGAALAQPLIEKWLNQGHRVTAICRNTLPHPDLQRSGGKLTVADRFDHPLVEHPFDLLVTMTGDVANASLIEMTDIQWLRVMDGCLTPVMKALRDCRLVRGANVVVVGSIVGSTGGYGCANYAAAKAGLVGLVRGAANEWAKRDICVNLLELGYLDAGMGARLDNKTRERVLPTIPLGRFGAVADFVQAVEYLASVRYMTGAILNLAGGLR